MSTFIGKQEELTIRDSIVQLDQPSLLFPTATRSPSDSN